MTVFQKSEVFKLQSAVIVTDQVAIPAPETNEALNNGEVNVTYDGKVLEKSENYVANGQFESLLGCVIII